jgi:prephenate dehydrogenase
MNIRTLTIVGVGLIGGSIGLAARRRGIAQRILGTSRTQTGIDQAKALDLIDEGFLDVAAAVHQAELTVFCTPVDCIAKQVTAVASGCAPGTVLTDAGSTKEAIVREVDGRLPPGVAFVGSHPLAGSEKRGPEWADADLFQGRLTIVTPTAQTDAAGLEKTSAFWRALGSRVRVMEPEEHDRALAWTSHLPHLAAAALAGILPLRLFDLSAAGFRDTTRVAAGDPTIWTGIFVHNRPAVLDALQQLEDYLSQFRKAIEAGDWVALDALLTKAKKVRDALGS